MKKYKLCVYAICKNEEQFVDRWIDSMSEADLIVVTDTGSSDNTVEKLKQRGAVVYVDVVKPWRFDVARNISMQHIPEDVDICLCTDLDEQLDKGWRECVEKYWEEGMGRGKYLYNWSFKKDGTPDVQFTYSKIHARTGYEWVHPCHEVLRYKGPLPEKLVNIDGMVLNHHPDPTKSRSSYLPLLEMAVEENPQDDRDRYYLGREYMYAGMWDKAIETLKIHLSLPTAGWNEERCASMRWIAKCYKEKGDKKEAKRWYYRAIAEAPHMRDPYVEFAKMAYPERDWLTIFHMVEEALMIKEKSKTYVNQGYSWDYTVYDLGALACYYLGMYDKSLNYAKTAMDRDPGNERLKNNYNIIMAKINQT